MAIDGIDAPARFRTPGLDRNQIGAVGRQVFAAFNSYELALGLSGLVLSRRGPKWRLGATALQAAAAAAQFGVLRPRMNKMRDELDFTLEDRTGPGFAAFGQLHKQYIALDGVKAVLAGSQVLAGP
ncbi:hypothetical protein BH23ACT9_BH23ACT9_36990 [soil metagenome]